MKDSDSHFLQSRLPVQWLTLCFLSLASNAFSVEVHLNFSELSSIVGDKAVTSSLVDSNGYLWIGTQRGLHFFDGASAHTFSAQNEKLYGIPASDIRGVSEDAAGRVILATYGAGLAISNQKQNHFERAGDLSEISFEYLTTLHRATGLGLWATNNNDLLYSGDGKLDLEIVNESLPGYQESDGNWVITEYPKIGILVSNGSKIWEKTRASSAFRTIFSEKIDGKISAVTPVGGRIYVGTDNGHIMALNSSNGEVLFSNLLGGASPISITCLITYRNSVWVGTNQGLFLLSPDLQTTTQVINSANSILPNDHITLLQNLNEDVIIGTYSGLVHANPKTFDLFNRSNSGVYNDIMAFEEDSNGALWVGTFNGVFRLDPGKDKHIRVPGSAETSLPDQRAMSLELVDDHMWIGFWENGISLVNLRSLAVERPPFSRLDNASITKILDSGEDSVWIGTYDAGIFRFENEVLKSFPEVGDRPVTAMHISPDNQLFAISRNSVFVHSKHTDSFTQLNIAYPGVTGQVIPLSLSADRLGRLLLGTKDHGPFWLDPESSSEYSFTATQFTGDPSVAASSVYTMEQDLQGRLWMSTDFGLVSLNTMGYLLYRFTEEDGLQGNDFNFGAHLLRSSGKLVFGGPNGYNQFSPDSIEAISRPVRVKIPSVRLGNGLALNHVELMALEKLELGSDTYSVTVLLGLNDFFNVSSNQYTHKLEGFDNTWIEAGTNNTITYTNLEPGTYTFRARGANAAGVWSENEVSLEIVVMPPWWSTWWALASYGLLAILGFWVVMRAYRNYLLKEEALRIAQEMHNAADRAQDDLQENQEYQDELVRAVSQHNLATLDLISQCMEQSGGDAASSKAILGHIKALELLEKCYFFQENELVADLHSYVDGLTNLLLTKTAGDPENVTSINRVTRETMPASIASRLAIIIYELLENSLSHNNDSVSSTLFVEIELEIIRGGGFEPTLRLCLADSGVGASRPIAAASSAGTDLKVVNALVETLGATCSVTSDQAYRTEIFVPSGGFFR